MKQNCKYFRYVHKLYFLEIKEVLVLFDKISSFRLCEDSDSTPQILRSLQLCSFPVFGVQFFDGRHYQRRATAATSSPYIHANTVHVHACARFESNPTSIVPSHYVNCFFFLFFFMWIFACFWMWHSIRSCTFAPFVTRGTLKIGTNQPTNQLYSR